MNSIWQAIGFLGLLAGLAVVADRLLSKEARAQFGSAIRLKIQGQTFEPGDLSSPLAFLDKIPPFSFRSLYVSILFSISSLIVVVYIQYFLLGYDFANIWEGVSSDRSKPFILLFLLLILGNFVVDFFSFTQTLVILNMINHTKSRASVFVVMITDLLASVNIFTFVYAFFLAVGLYSVSNIYARATFVLTLEDNEMTDAITANIREFGFFGEYHHRMISDMFIENANLRYQVATIILNSTLKLTPDEIAPGLLAALKDLYPSDGAQLIVKPGRIVLDSDNDYFNHDYQMRGSLGFWINQKISLMDWYSFSYLQTDEVQDAFFEVATLSPGFKSIDSVRYTVNLNAKFKASGIYARLWCVTDRTFRENDDNSCENSLLIMSNDLYPFGTELSKAAKFGGSIPLHTFFFTALALTLTVYLFYLSIYVTKCVFSFFEKLPYR